MTYTGEIIHGAIVVKDALPFEDGTPVRIEVEPVEVAARRGNGAAIAASVRKHGGWQGNPAELDRLLAELKEEKWAEVRREQAEEEPRL